jgi:hypothetical protein
MNGAWSFEEKNGKLTCNGKSVPGSFAKLQLWLFTPLGTFAPQADGGWLRCGGQIPLPNPTKCWVHFQIDSYSGPSIREHTKVGFYATHTLRFGGSSWQDTQITGTPPSWIYAFRVRDGKERGAWIAPEKLGEVNWEEILEKTETAQLD